MIKLMLLQSQRQNIYVNITGKTIDFCDLWIRASAKRYLKLISFYDTDEDGLKASKEKIKQYSTIVYFDSLEDFLKW